MKLQTPYSLLSLGPTSQCAERVHLILAKVKGGGMAVHCPKIAIAGPGGSQISDIKDTSSSVCPRSLQPESVGSNT